MTPPPPPEEMLGRADPWRHSLLAAAVGVTGVLLSLTLWFQAQEAERARIGLEFEAAAANHAAAVQRSVELQSLILSALRSWYASHPEQGPAGFRAFVEPLLTSLPGVTALEWIPRVPHARREEFESSMRSAGVSGFRITERDAQRRMVPAAERADYFPITDVEPGGEPSPVVGFDLGSEPTRGEALRTAAARGEATATGRLTLIETQGQYGFQIFEPIYAPGEAGSSRESRLRGFVMGVFRIDDLVEGALSHLQPLEIDVEIHDESAPPAERLLYSRSSRVDGGDASRPAEAPALSRESRIGVAGRVWSVRTGMRSRFVEERLTGYPAGLLLGGLTLTGLVVAGLVFSRHRNELLRQVNRQLRHEIAERRRTEEALRTSEQRYRVVVDDQTELVVRWRPDGMVSFANDAMVRLLDRPREQIVGTGLADRLGGEGAALLEKAAGLTAEQPVGSLETSAATPDGGTRWFNWTERALFDAGGVATEFQAVGRDVSERKQAQELMLEQQERFRRLSEASFEGIAVTFKGKVLDVNPQLAHMLGFEPAALIGKDATEMVAPESREKVRSHMRSGSEEPYEHLALRADGSIFPVEVRARSLSLAGRQVRITAVRDVTEQKRAQEELRQSRAFLDSIFTGLEVAVWVIDVPEDGPMTLVGGNPAWKRLAGPAAEVLIARPFEELLEHFPAEALESVYRSLQRCRVTGMAVEDETVEIVSGQRGFFLRRLTPLLDSNGRVWRIIGTTTDLTKMRQAEEKLRHSQRLLAEAQRIARLGGWEADLATGGIVLSEEVWRLVRTPGESLPRAQWNWAGFVSLVHPEDRTRFRDAMEQLLSGRPIDELELRLTRGDGSVTTLLMNGEIVHDASGRAVRVVGTLQDVTDRKRAEEEAERQRQELLRADKMIALGTLISGIAHEINNPNHFILLNLPLLRAAWLDAAPVLERHAREQPDFRLAGVSFAEMSQEMPQLLDEVLRGAERIKFIVSELRDYAREQRSAEEATDVNDAVRFALTLVTNQVKKATRRFAVSYAEELPPVRGNLRRLEQVVINLILNACQALPDPERAIRVETSFEAEEGRVVVTVADEGLGIPAADLDRITDPFFTTKRERGGTGLGLAVASRIVTEHGGRLSYESVEGKGTTARLSLPAMRDGDAGEPDHAD